jgi:hypothetical protein
VHQRQCAERRAYTRQALSHSLDKGLDTHKNGRLGDANVKSSPGGETSHSWGADELNLDGNVWVSEAL